LPVESSAPASVWYGQEGDYRENGMKHTALISLLFLACGRLPAVGQPVADVIDPAPGQLGAYEGETVISQTLGTAAATEQKVKTTLVYFVTDEAHEIGADRRVLFVRSVAPQVQGVPVPPYMDVGFYWVSAKLEVTPVEEGLDSPQGKVLDLHVPPDGLFPTGELPDSSPAQQVEATVLLGKSPVKLPVLASVDRKGSTCTLTRTLASGATAPFDLDDSPATLKKWRTTYVMSSAKKSLEEVSREFSLEGKRGDVRLQMGVKSTWKATGVRALSAAEKALAAACEKEISGILSDFAIRKHPRDIYQRIQALLDSEAGKLLPQLQAALLGKLAVYRQARDQEARSGAAGGLVGSPAPDFTLEAMDGSKVAFREATRGKVVLLSFWGVACSYCRKEAPYLTKLQEKFGDKGFTVIAVNGYDEDRETVAEYLAQEKLKHPVLLMGRGIARSKYQVTGFPTNVWIDAAGNVAHTEVGFTADHYSVMEARIQRMLASVQRANLEAISR